MNKKAALIVALGLFLVVGATGLMADTNWEGTFWGDASGRWHGTLYDSVEPSYFEGSWATATETGTFDGEATENQGVYTVTRGHIFDDHNQVIGYWNGTFDYHTSEASGEWRLEHGLSGRWSGYEVN